MFQQKQFILPFKPSGSNYLFKLNALEQGTAVLIRYYYKNFYRMFIKCSKSPIQLEKENKNVIKVSTLKLKKGISPLSYDI